MTNSNNNEELAITAVVLSWKRLSNVRLIIKKMLRRDFIQEIIIWNNNPDQISLTSLGLELDNPLVRIVNSEQNLRDKAKYLAASQAKFDHIYYQDDDWNTFHYIDAMHAAFCLNPDRFHVAIGELSWPENCFRAFHNEELGIQSQFCFMGVGAIFPKHIAQNHLKYIDQYLNDDESGYADYCLTLWMNQPFIRLQVSISAFSQENAFSSESEFDEMAEKLKKKAIESLQHFAQAPTPLPNTYIKSVFRNLLLFSNYIPKELEQASTYYDPQDLEKSLAKMGANPSKGVAKKFRKNPYFSALHIEKSKSWHTKQSRGQFWGILLLKPDNIQLNIKSLDTSTEDSVWEVKVDGQIKQYTFNQLKLFKQKINRELKVTLLTAHANIGVQIISDTSSR